VLTQTACLALKAVLRPLLLRELGQIGIHMIQGCALETKKFMTGLKRLGSSRLPGVIKTNCGNSDVLPKILPPQLGQNPRVNVLPLSAMRIPAEQRLCIGLV